MQRRCRTVKRGVMSQVLPPRILLVMPDQWPRALLRAELRNAGYDALGATGLAVAGYHARPSADRGPLRLIVLDQDALPDPADLGPLGDASDAPILLVAHALRDPPPGPWARVVRRPVSVGELVRTVEELVPLPPAAHRPID